MNLQAKTRVWWVLGAAAVLIVVWHLAALRLPPIILPTPEAALRAFIGLLGEPETVTVVQESLTTFLLGFVLAAILGAFFGVLTGISSKAAASFSPLLALLNSVPTVAWMGIAMMWFGLGRGPTIFLVVVSTLPILVINIAQTVTTADPALEELAQAYGVAGRRRIRYLIIPPLKSTVMAALIAMAGLGWKITIMGEFLTATGGLGELLVTAKAHIRTDRVFAITALLVVLWLVMALLLKLVSRWVNRRPRSRILNPCPEAQQPHGRVENVSTVLHCEGLALAQVGQTVIQHLSFTVSPGTVTVLLGPSGVGKSTVLRALAGLQEPASGTIVVEQKPALVFQEDRLVPWLTVADNLALTSKASAQTISHRLHLVGLDGSEERLPAELSGGMRRRVALVRGFLQNSSVLLFDEPFAGLDPLRRAELIEDIQRMRDEDNTSIVVVTHDVDDAALLADQVLILSGFPATNHARWNLSGLPVPRSLQDEPTLAARQDILTQLMRATAIENTV